MRNSAALRLALLRALLTRVIPLPLPLDHPQRAELCFWQQGGLLYETQTQLLRLLPLLASHVLAASLAMHVSREMDACRLLLLGSLVALADAVSRVEASDCVGVFAEHYSGRAFPRAAGGPSSAFGFCLDASSHFAAETDTLKFVTPELVVMRCQLLEYFASVTRVAPEDRWLFGWEAGGTEFGAGELALADQLCVALGHRREREQLPRCLSGETYELLASCPELPCLRDLLFYLKLFLSPSAQALPEPRLHTHAHPWGAADARLSWLHAHREGSPGKLEVRGFHRVLRVVEGPPNLFQRFFAPSKGGRNKPRAPPSGADPALFLGHDKPKDISEDEILALPTSSLLQLLQDDSPAAAQARPSRTRWERRADEKAPLPARDAELMLSYLTAPYLRIPLLLTFFADPQRIGALAHPKIQALLEAALFEPGAWQPTAVRPLPTHIPPRPTERAAVLGTPLGLLFNELVHAPATLLASLTAMVCTALDMETGHFEGGSTAVIFFLTRVATRVEAYALFVTAHLAWRAKHPAPLVPFTPAAAADAAPSLASDGLQHPSPQHPSPHAARPSAERSARSASEPSPPSTPQPATGDPPLLRRATAPSTVFSDLRTAASQTAILDGSLSPPASTSQFQPLTPAATSTATPGQLAAEPTSGMKQLQRAASDGTRMRAGPLPPRLAALAASRAAGEDDFPPPMPGLMPGAMPVSQWAAKAGLMPGLMPGTPEATTPAASTPGGRATERRAASGERCGCGAASLVRGLDSLQPHDGAAIEEGMRALRRRLDAQVFPLLERWFARAVKLKDLRAACVVAAHLSLLHGSSDAAELEGKRLQTHVSVIVSSHLFLTHNFSWALGVCEPELGVPQTEIFDVFEKQRAPIVAALGSGGRLCDFVMEAVTRVVTFTGPRAPAAHALRSRNWRQMGGERCSGRYVHEGAAPGAGAPSVPGAAEAAETAELAGGADGAEGGAGGVVARSTARAEGESYEEWLSRSTRQGEQQVEINLQLGEYSASAHKQMQLLPAEIVRDFDDFRTVFGADALATSFQSAEVEAIPTSTLALTLTQTRTRIRTLTTNPNPDPHQVKATAYRSWLRLVGRRHDLHWWSPPQPGQPAHRAPLPFPQPYVREMAPTWLSAALEPVRAAYFPELSLWQPLLADFAAPAALLAGRAADGTLKEVAVLQRTAAVLVYNVVEHGRRWYRTLVFCSRTDVSLATLPLSLATHAVPAGSTASSAAGFVCGDASTSAHAAASLVITRQARDTAMREGRRAALSIEQTFVPRRLLSGTLPESLLEAYTFWHTPDDGLTGYPQAPLCYLVITPDFWHTH